MSDESLSRNEVEELLRSMETAETKPRPESKNPAIPTPSELDSKAEALLASAKPTGPRQRVVAYDFKRPERVGKEQMRALQSLHEGFARNFGASVSALLRTIVEAKLISVDQLTYSEFVYSLEIPTCFNLLRPAPLEGNWILDISPSILYPIIDRMLGGSSTSESLMKRPLSEIELRLTSRITGAFLRELTTAWSNTVRLDISLERVESNPQLVQIVPPNEVVVLVSFELTMGKSRGMINLCVPFNTIERIGSKLTNNSWIGYASSRSSDESQGRIQDLLGESRVEMVVNLARTSIRALDLFNLQVGDIIDTEKDSAAALEVEVSGIGKFLGRPGAYRGKKAVEIVEQVETSPEKLAAP
jgi:flagellar motor switch protein FliM